MAARFSFRELWAQVLPPGTGYGFQAPAGHAFRITIVDKPQVVDLCILSADDPSEHYSTGAQMAIEGALITRGTRVWGTPPRSRPLCTCIADTVRRHPNPAGMRDHFAASGHCNAHLWYLKTGEHNRPCYDNLRAGMAMVGLSQRYIPDNLNIFQKSTLDPATGEFGVAGSDAEEGDYVEFFAETALLVVLSLCPIGGGADNYNEQWEEGGNGQDIPLSPIGVTLYETGIDPLGWPYGGPAHPPQ